MTALSGDRMAPLYKTRLFKTLAPVVGYQGLADPVEPFRQLLPPPRSPAPYPADACGHRVES